VRALAERHTDRTLVVPAKLFGELAVLPAGMGMLAVVPVLAAASTAPADFCLLLECVRQREAARG